MTFRFTPPPGTVPAARLILLHGAACGPDVWAQGFGQRLAQAGHPGLALPLYERTLSERVEAVRSALRDGPALLVGHSLGALVAQRLLGERNLLGAALLAPVPPEGLWWSNARLAASDPRLWNEVIRMTEPGTPSPVVLRGLFGPGMDPADAVRHATRLRAESSAVLLEAQMPQPVTPGWVHNRPVLVLGAEHDRLIPRDAVERCAAWHGVRAEILPGAGHLLMLDAGWESAADRVIRWASPLS